MISGPDGTGKSTLAGGLTESALYGHPVRRVHHRFRVLPSRASSFVPTTQPHAQPPYARWISRLKILYLFGDYLLGWYLQVRPFVRKGGWVIVERGWCDLFVDPTRYRIPSDVGLARRLAGYLPPVDRLFVLDAPPDVILRRSSELDAGELERQTALWRSVASREPTAVILDSTRPPEEVLHRAVMELPAIESADPDFAAGSTKPAPAASRWVALPPGRPTRWTVPSAPPRIALAGLRVHQPITLHAIVAWQLARPIAALGLLRLFPRTDEPDLQRALAEFIPPGGCVAVAHLRRPGRAVALIIDSDGHAQGLAKVADDARGREKLAREADALTRLGSLVEPPLSAPRLIAEGDGVIVFEAAEWFPRLRTWELPLDLARAIGRFYANGQSPFGSSGRGAGHGDFAPWNVMRTRKGWFLVDWEEAHEAAPPFGDPFHFLVQAHALLGRPSRRELIEGVYGKGRIGDALRAYADAAGLSLADAPEIFGAYLRTSGEDLRPEERDGERGLTARRRLLADLAKPR